MAESHPFVFVVKKMKKNAKAVTLVELLIVVFIISIFTFIAVPRMGMATVFKGKAQTSANQIASAIRLCRSLAISNAADNQQGYRLNISAQNFEIINLKTNQVIKTEKIQSDITCTGDSSFQFGPIGSRIGGTGSGGGKNYIISVVSATGMVKCVRQ
jgi:Tfp pilus assembly protein FimT